MWRNQIALRNVLGEPWPTVHLDPGLHNEIDDRVTLVAAMKEVSRLGSSSLTRNAEAAREIQEQHMHTAAADIGYAMKRNTTIGPSPPRTPPGGQKGPHPEAFPMPDRPRASPAGPPGGEWEAAPLSPVMEHDDEGGARAAPRHRARVECVVLDGGSRLERFEADRAPPPTPEGLTPAKSLSPGAGKKIPNMWGEGSLLHLVADADQHLTESAPHRAAQLPHASLFATLRQVKASREEREAKPREEELDQHRAAHDIRR